MCSFISFRRVSKLGNRGFGLVETMVAMLLGLVIVGGMLAMATVSRKQQLTLTNAFDFDNMKRSVQRVLGRSATCQSAFYKADGSGPLEFQEKGDNLTRIQLGSVVIADASTSLGGGLSLTSVNLRKIDGTEADTISVPGSSIYSVELILEGKKNEDSAGPVAISNVKNPFRFAIQVNNGTRRIEACVDSDDDLKRGRHSGIACLFEGTYAHTDAGSGNDFALTCRSGKMTGWCGDGDRDLKGLGRGLNANNYTCEFGGTPADDRVRCDFQGTWAYNDDGPGNDFAVTCRDGKLTGWCTHEQLSSLRRGLNAENFACENSATAKTEADVTVSCHFDGSYQLNDDGPGNDFGLTCRDESIAGWCSPEQIPGLVRGSNPKNYQCAR